MLRFLPGADIGSTTILHAGYGVWTTIATVSSSLYNAQGLRVHLNATSVGGGGAYISARCLYTNYAGVGSFTASQLGIYEDFSLINGQSIAYNTPGYVYANPSDIAMGYMPAQTCAIQVMAYDANPYSASTSIAVSGLYEIISSAQ